MAKYLASLSDLDLLDLCDDMLAGRVDAAALADVYTEMDTRHLS